MLEHYAERRGFKWEEIEVSAERGGGIKEGVYAIKGDGAYSIFKYEGGTHRVQRVPETESQGRIHTSTATVAVMPEAEDVDLEIDEKRPEDRRLPLVGPGRPVGEHDRLRRADHARPDRDRRRDAGRALAAPEPRQGDARAAGAPLRGRARARRRPSRRRPARRRSAPASGPRRSAPTTSPRTASPTTGSKLTAHRLEQVLAGRPRRVHRGADRRASAARSRRSSGDPRRGPARDRRVPRRARASTRRGSTPSCCSRTRSGSRGSSSTPSTTGR